jgi:outer membrane protein insertion porin family
VPAAGLAGPSQSIPPAQPSPDGTIFLTPGETPFTRAVEDQEPVRTIPFDIIVDEAQTGRFLFGVAVNSEAGLMGSIILDEQNFDWTKFPRSWEDIRNATAFRGAGQRLRIEAVPGTRYQRYIVNFTEPYLLDSQISLMLSGFFYDRRFREWDEERLGGRVGFGYQFTPDLSGTFAFRGMKVNVHDPVEPTPPELAEAVGDSALYGFRVALAHDTRDSAMLATEGHLVELSFEQVTGSYDYPRGEIDVRQYFTMHQRPDGSGRHVLGLNARVAVTGSDTPIYDHYFAGGFSTLRGFEFRSASPRTGGVVVGGEFMMLASAEYVFPITADDMLRGVVFCDTGTVERTINDWASEYRVAPGLGLRINIPAMGPAPIALDFAFPVSLDGQDEVQNFSFFVGFAR